MPRVEIVFNKLTSVGRELDYVREAVASGWLSGTGPFGRRCESWLEEHLGVKGVLLTHSCTAALEMAAHLCGVGEGDEVIMPSFTFVSTANAFAVRQARPVFVDIRPDTLNIDERRVQQALTTRTRAVVAVHYGGIASSMDDLLGLTQDAGVRLVEDAAQAVGAEYRGRPLGGIGDIGCLSFHETKNVSAGEGGALLLRDEDLVESARILRDKGTDREKFSRGEVRQYTWVGLGSSYAPSELVSAFLLGQLEHAEEIRRRRLQIWQRYQDAFADLADAGVLRTPVVPPECRPNGHLFHVLVGDEDERNALIAHLAEAGVQAVFHYVPLHESAMGRALGYAPGDFPVTESASRRLVRLPLFYTLDEHRQGEVIDGVRRFFSG